MGKKVDWNARLLEGAKKGDLTMVKQALAQGADLAHGTADDGFNALHMAAYCGHVDIMDHLHSAGLKIDSEDNYKQTALHHAARSGRIPPIEFLLEKGANIEQGDEGRYTPIFNAAINNRLAALEILLEKAEDLDNYSTIVNSLLYKATKSILEGHQTFTIETVETLLAYDAKISYQPNSNSNKSTTYELAKETKIDELVDLFDAAAIGRLPPRGIHQEAEETEEMMEHNLGGTGNVKSSPANQNDQPKMSTASNLELFVATAKNDPKAITKAFEKGADANAVDHSGNTCLMHAISLGNEGAVKCLLSIEQVSLAQVNNEGKSVLDVMEAYRELYPEISKLIDQAASGIRPKPVEFDKPASNADVRSAKLGRETKNKGTQGK